jgi:hypothetical protein
MHPTKFINALTLLVFCGVVAGCNFRFQASSQTQGSGDSPVVLAMTDTPPANVTILSAQVTLTGATLNPGSVPLLSGATTLELTRLQTDVAYLGTTLVKAGTYTSLTLTFANPTLTFENDSGVPFTGAVCSGTICTLSPIATNLLTTITLPAITVSKTAGAGLLADVNLNALLSSSLGADFKNGTTVSTFTPAGAGAPPVGAEDVVGQVTLIDMTHSTFSLQNALGVFSVAVNSFTTFPNLPAGACPNSSISCVKAGQILSVDIGIGSDGTAFARTVLLEDADATDAEVEGIVTKLNPASLQFTIVVLSESANLATTGLSIGSSAAVHYTGTTPFDVDFVQADGIQVPTTGFTFGSAADLMLGQQVQVRRNPSLSSLTSITADRVRLRSSRITATIQSIGSSIIHLGNLPSIFPFSSPPVTQIQGQTFFPQTIITGTAISLGTLGVTRSVSVRGPLFPNAGTPTVLASKVLQH